MLLKVFSTHTNQPHVLLLIICVCVCTGQCFAELMLATVGESGQLSRLSKSLYEKRHTHTHTHTDLIFGTAFE